MKTRIPFLSKGFGKKHLATIALLVSAGFTEVMAQIEYRTAATTATMSPAGSSWTNKATWEAREFNATTGVWGNWGALGTGQPYPAASTAGAITIRAGHTVKFPVLTPLTITADELTIEANGTLEVGKGKKLIIANGSGINPDLIVSGTLIAKGGITNFANIDPVTGAAIAFTGTGTYLHNPTERDDYTTGWGVIPTADWHPGSTLHISVEGSLMETSEIPSTANLTQNFGNVIWETPGLQVLDLDEDGANDVTNTSMNSLLQNIKGNFEVRSTGLIPLIFAPATSNSYSFTVGKDFRILNNSQVIFADGTSTNPATFNLNVGGDFKIAFNDNFTHSRASNPVNVTFTGNDSIYTPEVTINNMHFTVALGATMNLASNFAVPGAGAQTVPANFNVLGRLNTGLYAVEGGGNFNLHNDAILSLGHEQGLSTTSGNIITTGTNTLSDLATYIYEGTVAQFTGNALPATVKNLTINNTNGVTLTNPVTVATTLNLQNGVFHTSTNVVTINEGGSAINGESNGYINGSLAYNVTTGGAKEFTFLTGNGLNYRPVLLKFNQNNQAGAPSIYTVTQRDGKPTQRDLPAGISNVSTVRSFEITKTGNPSSTITDGEVILTYGSDDYVFEKLKLSVLKSNGTTTWEDLGGSPTEVDGIDGVRSGYFTTFSEFLLGNKTGGYNPLPVELISLEAKRVNETVELTWATASEKNNDFFTVERSANGLDFTAIANVKGAGTTSVSQKYASLDNAPLYGISYYSLAQTDLDGTISYSKIIQVIANKANAHVVSIYPNPAVNDLQIKVEGINSEAAVEIFNVTGQLMLKKVVKANEVPNFDVSTFPAGVYTVRVSSNNGSTVSKFLKR